MITISFDETYHEKDSKELYSQRYKKVYSFHNSMAPVQNDNEMFFINTSNEKLFNKTFEKAYGFYEGFASVKENGTWYTIDIFGNECYKERYSWLGNFQEQRCCAKDSDNNYFHINSKGKRVYLDNYKYVGDFKYSIAVVVNDEGYSTHIDIHGNKIHNRYFEELDIFHKGFAIAKDTNGYFHIDKKGNELYKERYKKIEPFYNGLAFCITQENKRITLEENNFCKNIILDYDTKLIKNLFINKIEKGSFAFFEYQVLYSILKLKIFEEILNGNNSEAKLSSVLNIDLGSLKLILKYLCIYNYINFDNKNISVTKKGELLFKEVNQLILYWQDLPFKVSTLLSESLIDGKEKFSQIYKDSFFDYLELDEKTKDILSDILEYYTIDYSNLINKLNFKNKTICDIAGGSGKLLFNLKELYPNNKFILADKYRYSKENVLFEYVDIFNKIDITADVFLLSRVLHDWEDTKAIKILKNVSNNMNENDELYIFETIVPIENIDMGVTISFHLLNFLGGKERTLQDFELLFSRASLKIENIIDNKETISLIKVIKI